MRLLAGVLALLAFVFTIWLTADLSDRAVAPLPVKTVREVPKHARSWNPAVSQTTLPPKPAEPRSHVTVTTVARSAPTTTTAPKLTVAASGSVPDLIRQGFAEFGPAVAEQAVRVAGCETGQTFDPGATNGAHRGLFQISGTYHRERVARLGFTWDQMYEAGPNITVAADLYAEQGWQPWTCRRAA